MDMVKTDKLVFEYEKRDEEGNVIGTHRAVDEVDLDVKDSLLRFLGIMDLENQRWQNTSMRF